MVIVYKHLFDGYFKSFDQSKQTKFYYHSNSNTVIYFIYTVILTNYLYYLHYKKCMFILNYLLLYVLMKFWCKISEDGDSAETCRS